MSQYNLNRVELIGNLGHDASTAYTQDGTPVVSLSLATKDSYQDGGGNWVTARTDWHKIKVWGGGDCQAFAKGDTVRVVGKARHDKREIDGVTKYFDYVTAKPADVTLVSRKGERAQQSAPRDEYDIGDLGPPLDYDGGMTPGA